MKIINLGGSCPICGVGTLTHYNSNNVTALICSDIQSEEDDMV